MVKSALIHPNLAHSNFLLVQSKRPQATCLIQQISLSLMVAVSDSRDCDCDKKCWQAQEREEGCHHKLYRGSHAIESAHTKRQSVHWPELEHLWYSRDQCILPVQGASLHRMILTILGDQVTKIKSCSTLKSNDLALRVCPCIWRKRSKGLFLQSLSGDQKIQVSGAPAGLEFLCDCLNTGKITELSQKPFLHKQASSCLTLVYM